VGRAIRVEVAAHTGSQANDSIRLGVYRDELAFGEYRQVVAEVIRIETVVYVTRVNIIDNPSDGFHLGSISCCTGEDDNSVVTGRFFVALHKILSLCSASLE
jgi:hypothetical protein